MLRYALALAMGLGMVAVADMATAQDKAETKTVEGKMVCTKCTLNETKACEHAVQVKEGGKEVTYYIGKAGFKEFHKSVCPAGSDLAVKVTGKLVEKDGKKSLADAKVEKAK